MILMLVNHQSLKKNNMIKIIHLYTSLDIMIMMLFYINKFDENKVTMSFMVKDIIKA